MTKEELKEDYRNGLISEDRYNDWLAELNDRNLSKNREEPMWPFIVMIYGGLIIWTVINHWIISPIFNLVRKAWGRDKTAKINAYIIICVACFGFVILWRIL